MSSAHEQIRALGKYCSGHRCETCPLNDPALSGSDDDLCVLSLAMEALILARSEGMIV